MRRLALLLLCLFACGVPADSAELGELEQASSSADGYGWRGDVPAASEHWSCNSGTAGQVCFIPRPRPFFESPVTANTYVRSIDTEALEIGLGVTWSTAGQAAIMAQYFVDNGPFAWTWGTPAVGGLDLRFVVDNTISGVLPNADINVSQVVSVQCHSSTPINQGTAADYAQCNNHVVKVDVQSLAAWATLWGATATHKNRILNQIFAHAMGASQGLGQNTSLGASTMLRQRIARFPAALGLTGRENCLLNSFTFEAPLADLNVTFGECL